MIFLKKLIKKTSIYKFLNYQFSQTNSKIDELNLKIKSLEQANAQINDAQNILEQKINDDFSILKNRTEQFEYINSELLLLQKNSGRKNILIVGFYGAPNTGDELMLQSILEKIDSSKYEITVMLANNPDYNLENYSNIHFIHYPKTKMDLNILANYFDSIIFGGGALIEDTYYLQEDAYKYNTASILIDLSIACILNNKKTYHIALSASAELTNQNYINKLDYIIQNSNHFSLRDINSLKTLEKAKITNINKIEIIPDLVFSLKPITYNYTKVNSSSVFIIGLVFIGFSDFQKLQNIMLWLNEYKKNIRQEIILRFIPFYDFCHSDIVNFENLTKSLNLDVKIEILPYFQKYEDIVNEFNKCNIIINMRYHSTLLSLKCGIPSINLIYDIHPHYVNKMNYLKDLYSLHDIFLSYKNLTKDSIFNALDYISANSKLLHLSQLETSYKIEEEALVKHNLIIKNILEN